MNNLLGGALGGQIIKLPQVDGREAAGASPDDPSREGGGITVEHSHK